jgi:hypothetical protein
MLTAQDVNHISHLAFDRAARAADFDPERWDAIIALKLLAHSLADREIAGHGFSMIAAPMR